MSEAAPSRSTASKALSLSGWWVVVFVVAELCTSFGDVLFGPWATMHWEELFNARAGVQFACGHVDAADALQYRTFCGGCTAEGLLAVPFFRTLGPTVLVWKTLLLVFHGAIVGAGAWMLHRLVSARAAVAYVVLLAAAPGWYRELVHTGWGNHAESMAFPLVAAALMVSAAHRNAVARAGLLLLAGVVAGFGLWFGQTSAWALPMLGVGALVVGRWASPLFGVGLGVGMLPWLAYYEDKPGATDATLDWWTGNQLATPAELWDWLAGSWLRQNIWEPTVYGDVTGWATVYWATLWALALWGGVRIALPAVLGRPRAPLFPALFAPVSLLVLVVIYEVRHDLWWNLPDPYVNAAFNLRYRTPLVPLLALCAATGAGWPWKRRRWTALSMASLSLVLAIGLVLRFGQWTEWRSATVGLSVYLHGGWPDKTVPLGTPPQPLRRMQGRPTDVQAAAGWVTGHDDALVDCRFDHIYELGRRVGIGAQDPTRTDIAELAEAGLASLRQDALERRFFADALARGLMRDSGEQVPHLVARLDELRGLDGLDAAVGRAAGRRAARAFAPERDAEHRSTLDPRVWSGVCEGRGAHYATAVTEEGRHAPAEVVPEALLHADAGDCLDTEAYASGLAFAWARYVGCDPHAEEALVLALGDRVAWLDDPRVQHERDLGCRLVRPGRTVR